MNELTCKLENDGTRATVTFRPIQPVALKLDVSGVEEALKSLGGLRATMTPEVPKSLTLEKIVPAVTNPAWVVEPDAMMGNALLHVRDPRYGWLHFLIPKDEARKLAGALLAQADAPPPGRQDGKPN
jgi:hypothetical protein